MGSENQTLVIIFWDDSKNRRERRETQRDTTTLCDPPRPLRLIFFAMSHLIQKKLKSLENHRVT